LSLKKGSGPKTLPATLTITGQGSTDKMDVTYHNRRQSEVIERAQSGVAMGALVVFVVESWDTDFDLTEEGIQAFEDEYPGIVGILMEGFHQARRKELEKN
jgi:kynurenine formamidase